MLSPAVRSLLFQTIQILITNANKPIDTRLLVTHATQILAPLGVNRHHAAGMLAAFKSLGYNFEVVIAGYLTLVS